jgi:hypothetical protein
MNFDRELMKLQSESDMLSARLLDLTVRHEKAREFTAAFLAKCSDVGMTIAGIGKVHELLDNEHWGAGASYSVFCHPDARYDGWPAIWFVAKAMGIGAGCGNSGQYQADTSKLIDGVYRCENGNWTRIDAEDDL